MVSHLREVVKSISDSKEIKLMDFENGKLSSAERNLDNDGDIDAAMREIRGVFKTRFSDGDYRKIEHELELNK